MAESPANTRNLLTDATRVDDRVEAVAGMLLTAAKEARTLARIQLEQIDAKRRTDQRLTGDHGIGEKLAPTASHYQQQALDSLIAAVERLAVQTAINQERLNTVRARLDRNSGILR